MIRLFQLPHKPVSPPTLECPQTFTAISHLQAMYRHYKAQPRSAYHPPEMHMHAIYPMMILKSILLEGTVNYDHLCQEMTNTYGRIFNAIDFKKSWDMLSREIQKLNNSTEGNLRM